MEKIMSLLTLETQPTKLKTAKPYFLDLTGKPDDFITTPWKLLDLIDNLKAEIGEIDEQYKLWNEVTHNLNFGIYLRGQDDIDDRLIPSVGRAAYTLDQERNLFHRFRRRSYSHYQRILTDWETLFLARHYYLPVRLMDWTSNSLAGLYWACWRKPNKDGAVWALVRQPDETYDLNVFDSRLCQYEYAGEFKFLIDGVKIIYPFYVSSRMTAQGCLFTIQDTPSTPLEFYPVSKYVRANFDIFHICKWKVPATKKKEILGKLNDMGISFATLFPDLEGLGRGIPEIEVMRRSMPSNK